MRFLFKMSFPVESGNKAAREGFSAIPEILAEQKPEAVYFAADNGMRTCFMVIDMAEASQIPRIAEPWFLYLNASINVMPVMVPADLEKAGPDVAAAVKKFG